MFIMCLRRLVLVSAWHIHTRCALSLVAILEHE